eukprot:1182046-Prorocentrum_minimum.AAC.7
MAQNNHKIESRGKALHCTYAISKRGKTSKAVLNSQMVYKKQNSPSPRLPLWSPTRVLIRRNLA